MEDNKSNISELIDRLYKGSLSDLELEELAYWYNSFDDTEYEVPESYALTEEEWRVRMSVKLEQRIRRDAVHKRRLFFFSGWSRVAAVFISFVLFGTIGTYLYWDVFKTPRYGATNIDVAPGGNKAMLTLSDGRKIDLDQAASGLLASVGDVEVRKSKNGEIFYQGTSVSTKEMLYSELETPKGGEYHLILPDGTHVWLNAASRLRFPQIFVGGERKVFLEGEAYFDVKHDAKPFKVEAKNQEVTVLGTAFNINAYASEPYVLTTLSRGKVKVISGTQEALLTPGEQSFQAKGQLGQRRADMETALAWRNGKLAFVDAEIEEIMREVGRWYDLEIEYPQGIPRGKITGGISRNSNLRNLLEILEYSGLKFRLEETGGIRRLIVLR